MKPIYLFLLFLLTLPLAAEQLPEAPKPHFDRIDWTLLASDVGARALDTYSTRWSIENHNHEMFLPGFIANHTATMAAYSGGMVALDYFAARSLIRHHHHKVAKMLLAVDGIQVWPWAIRNLTMPKSH